MSNARFSITRRGAREAVKVALAAERAKPEDGDQRQIEAAKTYLISQIDSLPPEINAVAISVNGEVEGNRSVLHQCTVQGEHLDI